MKKVFLLKVFLLIGIIIFTFTMTPKFIIPALAQDDITVYTFDELISAIEDDNGISTIYFGADITLTSGISIPTYKTTLVIDGKDPSTSDIHQYTDMNSNVISDSIYISSAAGPMSITMQNINITGRNSYGAINVYDNISAEDVTVTFKNVNYTGTQLASNRSGAVQIIDSSIIIDGSVPSVNPYQEVAETNNLILGGNVSIRHESADNSCFLIPYENAAFTVLSNSNINIDITNRELIFSDFQPAVTFGENSNVTINTNHGLFYNSGPTQQARSFSILDNARLNVIQNEPNTDTATIRCSGDFTVSSGAGLYMAMSYPSADPLIQLTSGNTISFNDPDSVVLYNKTGQLIDLSSSSGQVNINGELVHYWLTATDFPDAGGLNDTPLYSWRMPDGSNVNITQTVTSGTSTVTSNIIDGSVPPPTNLNFDVRTAHVLSIGRLPVNVDTVYGNASAITGTTTPLANISISYTVDSQPESATATADDLGSFVVDVAVSPLSNTILAMRVNHEFKTKSDDVIVWDANSLTFFSPPTDLSFPTTVIPMERTMIKRGNPALSLMVADTRVDGGGWTLTASISSPLTSNNSHTLDNALVFVDENDVSHPLTNTPLTVYIGEDTAPPTITTVSWDENHGILLDLQPFSAYAEEYSTTITWTLADAP